MSEVKLGLQMHSLREAFAENPEDTLKKVKEMGYSGVEITLNAVRKEDDAVVLRPAKYYKEILEKIGLECYGMLASWENVQPDQIEDSIKYNKEVGSEFLVIGSVSPDLVKTMDDVENVVSYMKEVQKILNANGIATGYHNHDSDFLNVIEGKTFFEHVFDNTPEDFVMQLDTGNASGGGYDSIELIKKYPHRSPFLHIKGYSKEKGYLAYIGEDDFNWRELIDCAIDVGGSKVFDVEFGQRGDYDPFERAKTSLDRVKKFLAERK